MTARVNTNRPSLTLPALAVGALAAAWALAQPAPVPPAGDPAARLNLAAEVKSLTDASPMNARTLADWAARRPKPAAVYTMFGLPPAGPERTPLNATITNTVTRGDVAVDLLHFQSTPGLYVTGNLYRPKGNDKKLPTVVYVCGHSSRGRDGNKTAFQDHGMWFARHGYNCLVLDTLQLGEVAGKHHGTYHLGRWWWHSRGYTPAGVECLNGVRAIDYLVSRKDVDADKIGVTGISGGGATTVWIAAVDPRVKVAVPVSGMSDLESYVTKRVINGHCDCMFAYNTARVEWTTLAGLIAPRPMLFANSDNDPIFPMDGNRRIFARLKHVYGLYGKADLVAEHISEGGHDYRPDLRLAVFRFFDKHLRGEVRKIEDAADKPLPGKDLRVFPEDRDIPRDAVNATADEVFVKTFDPKLPTKADWSGSRNEAVARLRSQVFMNLPEVKPARHSGGREYRTEGEWTAIVSDAIAGPKAGKGRTLIVLNEDEAAGKSIPSWALDHVGDGVARVMETRDGKSLPWLHKSPPNTIDRSFPLLGKTADLGRLYDVLSVLAHLREKDKGPWKLVGKGRAGVLVAYASLLAPGEAEVVAVEPTASHRDGPHFLGVMRHTDVANTLGLLAPRPLTLVKARDKAFARTVEMYEIAGAAKRVVRR